jgi:hypothetical protein
MVWVRTASPGESPLTLSFFSVSGMPSLRVAGACLVPACEDAAVGVVTESVNVHANAIGLMRVPCGVCSKAGHLVGVDSLQTNTSPVPRGVNGFLDPFRAFCRFASCLFGQLGGEP